MPNLTKFTKFFPIVAFAALATSGFAQESSDTPQTDTAEVLAEQLDLGQDVATELGTSYVKEEIGDWSMQCVRAEQEDPCQLYQLLKDSEGHDVAEIRLFRLPEGGGQAVAGATVIVPLETSLKALLTISIDGGEGKRYPFSVCSQIGCVAQIGLTKEDVSSFKKGAAGKVTIVPFAAPDIEVDLKLSLKGFTKGFDTVSILVQ